MTRAATAVLTDTNQHLEPLVDESATPTFERVLSVFESAPDGKPFDPAHVLVLTKLQQAAKGHYAKILNSMLESADGLPVAVIRGAQMLHRRMANAFGETALRLVPRPQLAEEQVRIAELALCAFRARADEIKWHAFEQTTPQRASWESSNRLMLAVESLGLERQTLRGDITCTDAFAHCLLLATLSVGILNAPQMELAHRWLAACARDMQVEPFFDPDAHWYQIDLARPNGPERVSPASAVSDSTRFLAVASLGAMLGQARAQLYAGELSVGATPNRITALHFGAFLDLAERLWSPDWRRANWRADRDKAEGEAVEVVLGFEQVLAALGYDEDSGEPAPVAASWSLRDKSATGLGALLPKEAGGQVPLGALIAFRVAGNGAWELGCIVRRIRAADDNVWMVGIKRLSLAPVAIDLEPYSEQLQLETEAAANAGAIYAPINTDTGRIDGVVIDAEYYGQTTEYLLPTKGGAFRIRANRVIDRGEQWVRFGFEVLGKK